VQAVKKLSGRAKVKFLTSRGMDLHVVRHPINPYGAPGWTRSL
jgi:hypothetical protein